MRPPARRGARWRVEGPVPEAGPAKLPVAGSVVDAPVAGPAEESADPVGDRPVAGLAEEGTDPAGDGPVAGPVDEGAYEAFRARGRSSRVICVNPARYIAGHRRRDGLPMPISRSMIVLTLTTWGVWTYYVLLSPLFTSLARARSGVMGHVSHVASRVTSLSTI
jgi:hypothetical protein